jgi:hypothetical protein
MTYVLEVYTRDGDDSVTRSFKTERGAIAAGGLALERLWKRRFYGYLRADRWEGPWDRPRDRHVVAEWRDGGRLLAKVWR